MSFHDPFDGTSYGSVRASDADREHAADQLRHHHAEGRLRDDEFEARIERCVQARTIGELDRLVADLPNENRMPAFAPLHRSLLGGSRSPVALIAAVVGIVWLLGVVLSSAFGGWGPGYGHYVPHPPLLPLLFIALIAWRMVGSGRGGRFSRRG